MFPFTYSTLRGFRPNYRSYLRGDRAAALVVIRQLKSAAIGDQVLMRQSIKNSLVVTLVALSLGAVAIFACSSGKLTRSRVKALIRDADQFKQSANEPISLGTDFRRVDYMRLVRWDLADDLVVHSYLRKDGKVYSIGPEGEKVEKDWGHKPGDEESRLIPIATRKVRAVTGVAVENDSAQAEFTWRYAWTTIGAEMADTGQNSGAQLRARYDNAKVHEGKALFRRYDDGWRVMFLSLQ
jgi:hypothetical protein